MKYSEVEYTEIAPKKPPFSSLTLMAFLSLYGFNTVEIQQTTLQQN